jgi:hypothetical protein
MPALDMLPSIGHGPFGKFIRVLNPPDWQQCSEAPDLRLVAYHAMTRGKRSMLITMLSTRMFLAQRHCILKRSGPAELVAWGLDDVLHSRLGRRNEPPAQYRVPHSAISSRPQQLRRIQ